MSDGYDALLNIMRREVLHILNARVPGTMALLVTSYNARKHAIKGTLMPSSIETGWIPVATPHATADAGVLVGPTAGDQFVVMFAGGDASSPIATHRLYSTPDPPPVVQSGEIKVRHKSGTEIFLDQQGQLTATHGASGNTITMAQDNSITLTHKATGSTFSIDKDGNHVHDAKGKAITIKAGSFSLTGAAMLNGQPIATTP